MYNLIPLVLDHRPKMDQSTFLSVFLGAAIWALARKRVEGILESNMDKYLFPEIISNGWFNVVSFDNLAIKQLHVQEHMPKEQWDEFYMGDDGKYTFYVDMVDGTFGKNSLATERYPIMDNIDDMFAKVRE